MADVAVSFLLENLTQLLSDKAELLAGVRGEANNLRQDLDGLNAFLKQTAKYRSENENLKDLVKKIRKVVYEAEDAIDKLVIETKLHKNKSKVFRKFDLSHYKRVNDVALDIKIIRESVKEIQNDKAYGETFTECNTAQGGVEDREPPVVEEDDVVGFEEEAQEVIGRLLTGSDDLEAIPIVGMTGLGKTTLATKVFNHEKIEFEFTTRIWVYVSQSFKEKDLYLNILSNTTGKNIKYDGNSENVLVEKVGDKLRGGGRCLIVLDDVWSGEVWDYIKKAFRNNKNRNRVLLTTRNRDVAKCFTNTLYDLRFLTEDESWELLEKKVFHKVKCPPELERPGQSIARKCEGLPLAIVVIAGALIGKGQTTEEWEQVDESVPEHLLDPDNPKSCNKLVQMSYDRLPFDMKACFLYCAAFPRGFEIPAWKLIRLWISEGFIQYKGILPIESKAKDYLNVLVNRNLVIVKQWTSDGQIKTCRVHDMLHEFCWKEATSVEHLFGDVKLGAEKFDRRLCIYTSVLEFIREKSTGEHVRSFLCFPSEEQEMPDAEIPNIPTSFPLLRVLDVESVKFNRFCREFWRLYHLRYIAFSSNLMSVLPKQIGDFWNVQTLIVNTEQSNLDIQADIWNMPWLRHLHTNTSATLPIPKRGEVTSGNESLQTLSTIAPKSCTENVFARAPNLKKLGIRGEIAMLLKTDKSNLFNNVKELEKLKLINVGPTEEHLRLAPSYIFPKKLRKLTLFGTWLKWDDMSVLGNLQRLEVLKLKENAFMGEYWKPKVEEFPSLLVLWIKRTNLATWNASADNFPRLKRLVLISCDKLEEIPIGLADISSLQVIELRNSTQPAAKSARDIQAKKDEQSQDGANTPRFKLFIFPPDLLTDKSTFAVKGLK